MDTETALPTATPAELSAFVIHNRPAVDQRILRAQRRTGMIERQPVCDGERVEWLTKHSGLLAWASSIAADCPAALAPEHHSVHLTNLGPTGAVPAVEALRAALDGKTYMDLRVIAAPYQGQLVISVEGRAGSAEELTAMVLGVLAQELIRAKREGA